MAFVNSALTFSKFFQTISAIVVIGVLLCFSFLIPDDKGRIKGSLLDLRRIGFYSAIIWSVFSLLIILASLANVLGVSIDQVFDQTMLRSYTTQVILGQSQLFQLLIAVVISISFLKITKNSISTIFLILAITGLVAPVFQSHSPDAGSHAIAAGSLVIHVIAISFWVGGLIAIGMISEGDRQIAVNRFSTLALWAAIAVTLSGLVNAWVRLNFKAAIGTLYFNLILLKLIATGILIYLGYLHRKNLMKNTIDWKAFFRLATFEIGVMIFAVAVGAWLNTNQPPDRGKVAPNLLGFEPDALFAGGSILFVALYLKGMAVLRHRGDTWPKYRLVFLITSLLLINWATSSGLGLYPTFKFSDHMIGHMILGMIAPIGIVLAAPITLALRTLPSNKVSGEFGTRGLLLSFLHSRYAKVISHPISALAIFDGSLFVLYFTPLFGNLMSNHVGHLFMNLHFILAGVLFYHVIIGIDPNPFNPPYIVRLAILLAAMSIHAFFSVALMSARTLLDGGYYLAQGNPFELDLLTNQQLGGAIGWAMSEIPILIALIAVFIKWMRDDRNEAARIDRSSDRALAMGKNDELGDYNQYLAELSRRDQGRNE